MNSEKDLINEINKAEIEAQEEFEIEEYFDLIKKTDFNLLNGEMVELDSSAPVKGIYKDKQVKARGMGVVIYMDKSKYGTSADENMNVHFPLPNEVYGLITLLWIGNFCKTLIPDTLIVNHEHGDIKKECHKQIFVSFTDKINRVIGPGSFVFNKETYLIMGQAARSPNALANYCRKNGNNGTGETYFEFKFPEPKPITQYLADIFSGADRIMRADGKTDVFKEVLRNEDFKKNYFDIFTKTPKRQQELMVTRKKELFQFRDDYIQHKQTELAPTWHFPAYAIEYMEHHDYSDQLAQVFDQIHYWFNTYCINNNPLDHSPTNRKRALFVYGKREQGKTRFFQSLLGDVNEDPDDNPFIVYCRTNITAKDFQRKEKTAHLLILDDIEWKEDKHKEMLKALMVGETTCIESKHVDNYKWKRNLPCVILTNEKRIYRKMKRLDVYKDSVLIVATYKYLGPPGTEPVHEERPPVEDEECKLEEEEYDRQIKEWVERKNNK